MTQLTSAATVVALLASLASASAQFKTVTPKKVASSLLNDAPYRHNGVLMSGKKRGSALHAWHPNTIFSAANAVFSKDGWTPPPLWYPQIHANDIDGAKNIQTRGYVRWTDYASLALDGPENEKFNKDVIIAFAFEPLAKGTPAKIDTRGASKLSSGSTFTITGYPKKNAYLGEEIAGYFLHQTKPTQAVFRPLIGQSYFAPLVSTGPGNYGGPVWIRGSNNEWLAGGIQIGGLPSEIYVYGFTGQINSLLRVVEPIVSSPPSISPVVTGVSATSLFFPYLKRTPIPDGSPRWTSFKVNVNGFDIDAKVTSLKLNLDIRTPHRGDLQVMLSSPEGVSHMVHNEQGADKNHLIFKDRDLTEAFADSLAYGPWTLHVQDRLKGDTAILNSFRIEVSTDDFNSTDEETTDPVGTLGSFVFNDADKDGQQDDGEVGLDGVAVTLYRPGFGADGIAGNEDDELLVSSTISADGGLYTFTGLPAGTYQISFGDFDGYSRTRINQGEDATDSDANVETGLTENIALDADATINTIDAGYYTTSSAP